MDKRGFPAPCGEKKSPKPETLKKVNDLYRKLGIGQVNGGDHK